MDKSGWIHETATTWRISSSIFILVLVFCSGQESNAFCSGGLLTELSRPEVKGVVFPILVQRPRQLAFVRSTINLGAKKLSGEEAEDEDIPGDWNESDILAEFDNVDIDVSNDSVEDVAEDEDVVKEIVAEDDDVDDDVDLDEIDLDEDDEDDGDIDEVDLVEEIGAEYEDEEYAYVTVGADDEDFEDDGEAYYHYELEDDDDPNYMKQKELAEIASQSAIDRAQDEAFDPIEFMMNDMTDEQHDKIQQSEFFRQIEERMKGMELSEVDVGDIDIDEAVEEVPDLMADDPYPRHEEGEVNIATAKTGLTDDDLEEFDQAYKTAQKNVDEEPWDKVMMKDLTGWDSLSDETIEEMEDCLEEIGGSAYNVTRWLLYDLDFNVTNLILAAMKHNREAPILFQHWYPQLVTYKRYQHARDRNFDFTWEDVKGADLNELERYYAGFGYEEIPNKAPVETGIISFEDLDEDEIKMAAFESWMKEVYNPEWDRKDFDDDDMQDEDNVFSRFYEAPQHPDMPSFEDSLEDIELWNEEMGDDDSVQEYRDMMGKAHRYEVVTDEEFQRDFRGHLIVACTGDDSDLEIAEKITMRFEKELGKQVFVETRILQLAREEDNVFEVWLESYEIDLLHSKKRATSNAKGWVGPADCDDAQIDFLVDRVRFLTSDEARYSYRMEDTEMTE